jgi:hypothetical protein
MKLVVLSEQNIREFGKMPDGTKTYVVKQSDLTGKEVFEAGGEIDTFLNSHKIKFRIKSGLINSILHPKLASSPKRKK